MTKKNFSSAFLAAIIILFGFLQSGLFLKSAFGEDSFLSEGKVCFGLDCFRVEVASQPDSRARGLMFRGHLKPDAGMLFIFGKEGHYGFWMKNTFIPLDIIWINRQKQVVHITHNARPCLPWRCEPIYSNQPALYVLEVNAGLATVIGLKTGDSATLLLDNH